MRHVKDRYGIPGIALSGYAAEEDIQDSRRAGFIAHMAKPVTCSALEATVQQVASLRGSSRFPPVEVDPSDCRARPRLSFEVIPRPSDMRLAKEPKSMRNFVRHPLGFAPP